MIGVDLALLQETYHHPLSLYPAIALLPLPFVRALRGTEAGYNHMGITVKPARTAHRGCGMDKIQRLVMQTDVGHDLLIGDGCGIVRSRGVLDVIGRLGIVTEPITHDQNGPHGQCGTLPG